MLFRPRLVVAAFVAICGIAQARSAEGIQSTESEALPKPQSYIETEPASTVSDVIFLVDVSHSMHEPSKWMFAKWLVSDLLDTTPEGLPTGFAVFGHKVVPPQKAVNFVRELSPMDWSGKTFLRRVILQTVPAKSASVETAIGLARKRLQSSAWPIIVLISDGGGRGPGVEAVSHIRRSPGQNGDWADLHIIAVQPDKDGQSYLNSLGGRLHIIQSAGDVPKSIQGIAYLFDEYRQDIQRTRDDLVADFNQSQGDVTKQVRVAKTLYADLNACEAANVELKKAVESQNDQIRGLVDELNETQEQLTHQTELAKDQTALASDLKAKFAKCARVKAEAEATVKDRDTTIDELYCKVKELQETVDAKTACVQELDACLDSCESELAAAKTALCEKEKELQQCATDRATLCMKLECKQAELCACETELAAVKTALSDKDKQLEKCDNERTALRMKLECKVEELRDCEADRCRLVKDLEAKECEYQKQVEENQSLTVSVGQLEKEVECRTSERDQINCLLKLCEKDKCSLEADIARAEAEAKGAMRELSRICMGRCDGPIIAPTVTTPASGPGGNAVGGTAGGSPGPAGGSPSTSPGGSPGGSPVASTGGSPGGSPSTSPGGSPGGSPVGGSPGGSVAGAPGGGSGGGLPSIPGLPGGGGDGGGLDIGGLLGTAAGVAGSFF